jgi:hypothetical protein
MSGKEKLAEAGRFLADFWLPPSAPGGSRANSVGRALQATARNNPTTEDWVEMVGRGLRLGGGSDHVVPARGQYPQSQAQAGGSNPLAGALGGLLFGGMAASDPQQARQQERAAFTGSTTELAREIASVRSNPSLSLAQKREKVARLQALMQERRQQFSSTMRTF